MLIFKAQCKKSQLEGDMKKIFLMALLFYTITGTNTSMASMIQIYDFNGSYNASIYDLYQYQFITGDYNQVEIATINKNNFNNVVTVDKLQVQILIDMFQRTYIPKPLIEQDEFTYMYKNNVLYGYISFREEPPSDAGWNSSYYFSSIPDFSIYQIEALYLSNSFSTDGASGVYDIQLLADATPIIPEPSTILLLGIGLSALVFIKKVSTFIFNFVQRNTVIITK